MLHNQSIPVQVSCPTLCYNLSRHPKHTPFPPDTTAFLYYLSPPERPRIAVELRLRVATSDDHASFESGFDLLKSNGQPWSRSIFQISKYYIPLYKKLREDGLVPDDLDAVLSTFPPRVINWQHLYSLNDTFIVDFSFVWLYFAVITELGMSTRQCIMPFARSASSLLRISPFRGAYTNHHLSIDDSNKSVGSTLARFERSTLPEHEGTRTVVLRFLKIITPVKCVIPDYDGSIVPPKGGELHRKHKRRINSRSNAPVWGIDIDKSTMSRSLKLLWDA